MKAKILLWIFFTLCTLCAIGIGPSFFGILMLATAIMSMPIKSIHNIWAKILKNKSKKLKTLLIICTFVISILGYSLTLPNEEYEVPPFETTAPEITAPETTAPETTASETTVPETTVPETTAPETTVPETTVPETTAPETTAPETTAPETISIEYILSLETQKFHYKGCRWEKNIKEENRGTFTGNRETLISQGYSPCGTCKP